MIHKHLDSITRHDIQSLISSAVRESRTIEYKRDLTFGTDDEKKKFLAQVTSFANSYGGDLVIGVSATDGVPTDAPGCGSFNADQDELRLLQMIRDSIDPRIPDIGLKAVEGFAIGPVLVVRVGRSWLAPHMITFRTSPAFFARNSNGKHPMDVVEIRDSFLRSEQVIERMAAWREERLHQLWSAHRPAWLQGPPWIVLHVMPLASFERRIHLKLEAICEDEPLFGPLGNGVGHEQINIDGVIRKSDDRSAETKHRAYCQVYRAGQIETVNAELARADNGTFKIAGSWLEEKIIVAVKSYLYKLKSLEVPPPVVIAATLLGVANALYYIGQSGMWLDHISIDRDRIDLPQITVQDFEVSVPTIVRPLLDGLANAAGLPQSPNYTIDGQWNRQ